MNEKTHKDIYFCLKLIKMRENVESGYTISFYQYVVYTVLTMQLLCINIHSCIEIVVA